MSLIIKIMLKNLIGMLIGKHMIIWGLEFAAKQTKNKIDDNIVILAKAAYESDESKLRLAISNLTEIYNKKS